MSLISVRASSGQNYTPSAQVQVNSLLPSGYAAGDVVVWIVSATGGSNLTITNGSLGIPSDSNRSYSAWSHDGEFLLNVSTTGILNRYRTSDWSLVESINLGCTVQGNGVWVTDTYVYVACTSTSQIRVYDPNNSWSLVTTITTNVNQPFNGVVSLDSSEIYFTSYDTAGRVSYALLFTLDTATNTVDTGAQLRTRSFFWDRREFPFISPDGAYVYVGCTFGGWVDVFRTSDHTVVASPDAARPNDLAITPDSAYVYVCPDGNDDTITVIETTTHTVLTTLEPSAPAGNGGSIVAVSSNEVWYCNAESPLSTIDVIRVSDNQIIDSFSTGTSLDAYSGRGLFLSGGRVLTSKGIVFDVASHEQTGTCPVFTGSYSLIQVSPDGTMLVGTGYGPIIVRVEDLTPVDASSVYQLGDQVNDGTTLATAYFWHVIQPVENNLRLFNLGATANRALAISVALTDASPFLPDPANYGGQANASSTTVTAPALGTFPITDGIDIALFSTAYGASSGGTTNFSPPGGYAEHGDLSTNGTTSGVAAESAYLALTAVTTVGSISATAVTAALNAGFHVFIESPRFRFSVDAWLMEWSDWSETWSNLVVAGGQATFTLDAQIIRTTVDDFTLDALIVGTVTDDFLLDAWLQRAGLDDFTLDAILLRVMAPTGFTLDAWIPGGGVGAFDVFALIDKLQSGTPWTLDALVLRPVTDVFTLDATVFATIPLDFLVDAEISGGAVGGNFSLDAIVGLVALDDFSLDAWLQSTVSLDFTLDAIIQRTWTFGLGESFEDDFNRTVPQWEGFGNSWVQGRGNKSAVDGSHGYIIDGWEWEYFENPDIPNPENVDVFLDFQTPLSNPLLWMYVYLQVGGVAFDIAYSDGGETSPYPVVLTLYNDSDSTEPLPVDEATWYRVHAWSASGSQYLSLWKVGDDEPETPTLSSTALTPTDSFWMELDGTVDGQYFLVDNLVVRGLLDFPGITLDAELFLTGGSFTLDAAVVKPAIRDRFNLYALIARNAITIDAEIAPGGVMTLDAMIVGSSASAFTLDAWVFDGTTWTFGWPVSAVLRRSMTGTFLVNATIVRLITVGTGSAPVDAVCLAEMEGSFILDAVIDDGYRSGSFTVNADILGQDEKRGSVTLDAIVRLGTSDRFLLFAEIVQVPPFRIDAWLAGAFTIDAYLVSGTHAAGFTLDALLTWRGFTLDAVVGRSLTIDAYLMEVGGTWTPTDSFTLDAVTLAHGMTGPFPIWISAEIGSPPPTGSFTLNAWIRGPFTLDAWIAREDGGLYGGSFTLEAFLRGNATIVWPEDGGPALDPEGNPWPDWFKASRKYRIKITVDGTDITGDVIWSQTSFTQNAKTNPGTFEIALRGTSSFDGGEIVYVEIDDFRTFGGYVLSVERGYSFDADATDPVTTLRGADFNILFDKLVVYNKASATGSSGSYKTWKAFKVGTYDDTIINKVLSSYVDLPAGFDYTTYVDRVDVAALEVPWTMPTAGTSLRQVMQSLSQVTTAVWWIDPYLHLHNHSRSTITAPYPITDGTGGITGRVMSVTRDMTKMVNDDIVWGTLARTVEGDIRASHKTDDASIAAHGLWQYGEFRSDLHHTAYINRRSQSILDRYSEEIHHAKIEIFEPGYQAGMGVQVISTAHGVSETLVIRSMTLQMAAIKERDGDTYYGVPRYELSIGLDPEDPWDIYDYLPWPDDHDVPWHSPWVRCKDCQDEVCDCSTAETFDRVESVGWGVSEIDGHPWVTSSAQQFYVDSSGGQFKGYDQFQEAQISLPASTVPFEVLTSISIPAGSAGYVTSVALEGSGWFYADLSREAGGTLELYAYAYDSYLLDQTVNGLLNGFDNDKPILLRLRVESDLMQVRLWFSGTEEPEAWTAEVSFPVAWTSYPPSQLILRFGNLDVPITHHGVEIVEGYVCGGYWSGIGAIKQKYGVSYINLSAHNGDPDYFGVTTTGIQTTHDIEAADPWTSYTYPYFTYPGWTRISLDIDTGEEKFGWEYKGWTVVSPANFRAKVDINDPYRSGYMNDLDGGTITFDTMTPPIMVGLYHPFSGPGGTQGSQKVFDHNIIGDYRPFQVVPTGTWFSIPPGGLLISPESSGLTNISTGMPPTGHGYGGILNPYTIWPKHEIYWKNTQGSVYSNPSEPEPFILTIEYYEGGMVWTTPGADDCADIEGEVFGAVTEGWGCETLNVENGVFVTTGLVSRNTLTVYDADTGEFLHPTSDWDDYDSDGKDFTVLHTGTVRVIACYRNHVENVESKYATMRVSYASKMRVMPV